MRRQEHLHTPKTEHRSPPSAPRRRRSPTSRQFLSYLREPCEQGRFGRTHACCVGEVKPGTVFGDWGEITILCNWLSVEGYFSARHGVEDSLRESEGEAAATVKSSSTSFKGIEARLEAPIRT
jgi:hypothetical protein